LSIIAFLFDNTYFSFNDNFYKQTFGTPMGASVSPILATYVMDDLLNTVLPVLSFKPFFIKKYVDDIILALPREGTTEIVETLNSYDPFIQFTMETEDEQNSVPFLDTKFIRTNDNKIIIDWYRKPCSSGRYLNYHSYHKHSMKINLVKQMKTRVLKISDPSFHNKNLKVLLQLFTENSYPTNLLKKILFSTSNTITQIIDENPQTPTPSPPPLNGNTNETHISFVALPYIKEITPGLSRIIKQASNVKIANTTVLTTRSVYSRVKDKTSLKFKSDVVYRIPCADCEKVYIGQTSRTVADRLTAHRSDCRLHPDRCALAEHANTHHHNMEYASTRILATQPNITKRLFLEMAFISQEPNCINKRTDIKHLSELYSYLLSLDVRPLQQESRSINEITNTTF